MITSSDVVFLPVYWAPTSRHLLEMMPEMPNPFTIKEASVSKKAAPKIKLCICLFPPARGRCATMHCAVPWWIISTNHGSEWS